MKCCYLDHQKRFAFVAPAKTATTSLRAYLWELRSGTPWEGKDEVSNKPHAPGDNIWIEENLRGLQTDVRDVPPGTPLIAMHRDTADRVVSYFSRQVMWKCPRWTLKDFLDHLLPEVLFSGNTAWARHVAQNVAVLGSDPGAYDYILPVSRADEIPALLEHVTGGEKFPPFPSRNRVATPPLEPDVFSRTWLDNYAALDRWIGWDGRMEKLP